MSTGTNERRRALLVTAGLACIAGSIPAAWSAAPGGAETPPPQLACDRALLQRALRFLGRRYAMGEQVIAYPIARLQREFRTGYRTTCDLAEDLAALGCWTLRPRANGSRYARLNPNTCR